MNNLQACVNTLNAILLSPFKHLLNNVGIFCLSKKIKYHRILNLIFYNKDQLWQDSLKALKVLILLLNLLILYSIIKISVDILK